MMSIFADVLRRLRIACDPYATQNLGMPRNHARVRRDDLIDLLHHFDRLDGIVRANAAEREMKKEAGCETSHSNTPTTTETKKPH